MDIKQIKAKIVKYDLARMDYVTALEKGFLREQDVRGIKFSYVNEMDFMSVVRNVTLKPYAGEYFNRIPKEHRKKLLGFRWLDAGSNIGWFSLRLCRIFHPQTVISCEPYPPTYSFLTRNISLNQLEPIIIPKNIALISGPESEMPFYIGKKTGAMNSLRRIKGRNRVTVSTLDFDACIEAHEIVAVKMDIEGYEYEIIKGSSALRQLKVFLLEYHFRYNDPRDPIPKFYETLAKLDKCFDVVIADRSARQRYGTHIYCYNNDQYAM